MATSNNIAAKQAPTNAYLKGTSLFGTAKYKKQKAITETTNGNINKKVLPIPAVATCSTETSDNI